MTINFYLDSKKSSKEEKSIYCYVRGIAKKKTIYLNTGLRINPKYWNKEKQNVRKNYIGHTELNTFLSDIKTKIQKEYSNKKTNNDTISAEDLQDYLKKVLGNKQEEKSFFQVFDMFLDSKKSLYSTATFKKYKVLENHLHNFETFTKVKILFNNIDLHFYDQFYRYLIDEKKHTNNTSFKYIIMLKTFLRWATDRKFNSNKEFLKFKPQTDDTEIIYLSENELMNLYNMDLSKDKTLAHVRDVFCFECFTGQRFSDIKSLRDEDIKEDFWYLRTTKTRDILQIPLNDFAKEILHKYKDFYKALPVISSQKTNQHLKELAKLAGIDEPITITRYRGSEKISETKPKYELVTTHTGRRTFVTLSLEKGMRAETAMEITGHKDYKTFKRYLKITNKVKANEMNSVWKKN